MIIFSSGFIIDNMNIIMDWKYIKYIISLIYAYKEKTLHNKPVSGNTECEGFSEVCIWVKAGEKRD